MKLMFLEYDKKNKQKKRSSSGGRERDKRHPNKPILGS
jgi:hypothetical protein